MSGSNVNSNFISRVGDTFVANSSLTIANKDLKERVEKLGGLCAVLGTELEQYKDMLYHVLERPFVTKVQQRKSNKKNGNGMCML